MEKLKNHNINKSEYDNVLYKKYLFIDRLGEGTYGDVVRVSSIKHTSKQYALKITKNNKQYNIITKTEYSILKTLKHPNIIKIINFIKSDSDLGICLVLPLYSNNLYKYIRTQLYINNYDTCHILIQLCNGLDYLKKNNIIHRDLKPENILMNDINNIVIIDFGMAVDKTNPRDNFKFNVQTIYYRSPEIFIQCDYDESIDIWSLGCIAYEIYCKKTLFKKKDNISLFIEHNLILGPPTPDFISKYQKLYKYYDDIEYPFYMIYENNKYPLTKSMLLKNDLIKNKNLANFILDCLCWNKDHRITPNAAVKVLKNMQKKIEINM